MAQVLSIKRKQILDCISESLRDRGYPPSVREIGESVGLASSSTVHAHLAVLQREGYLRRDPSKPRAIEVRFDPSSKVVMDSRPIRHVPLVGDVAAGTGVLAQENIEELYPLPEDFTGTGSLFMVKVHGDSMVDDGIVDGDFVVVRQQPEADNGDIVVAGIPDDEATVKTYSRKAGKVVLTAANPVFPPMVSQMIKVGEETGELEKMLSKIADFYEDEVNASIKALTSILEPILMLGVGAIVGVVVISMYLPIFNMMNIIK